MARTIFDMAANTWREQREKIQLGLSFESEFDVPIENKHTLADLIRNVECCFLIPSLPKGTFEVISSVERVRMADIATEQESERLSKR